MRLSSIGGVALALALIACDGDSTDGDAATDANASDAGTDGGTDAGPPPDPSPATPPFARYVDPFIGTGGTGFNDIGSIGPGPQRPFGMIRPGPDTMGPTGAPLFTHCSGYAYTDEWVRAFSHTRMQGVGITDWGAVALMPTVHMSRARTEPLGLRSRYDKASEVASPGYYATTLETGNIRVELSSGRRAALHRYRFEAGSDAAVALDLGHALPAVDIVDGEVTIDPDARELRGFSHFSGGYSSRFGGMPVFFVMRFDHPFDSFGTWREGALEPGETSRRAADGGAYVRFDVSERAEVRVAVAISYVDVETAAANLEAEPAVAEHDFDQLRAEAEAEWERSLERVEIEARYERDFVLFYSAVYRTLLMPTLATEADGRYRGLDGEVHVAEDAEGIFTYYSDLSLWDTFRTLHPWLSLLYPEVQRDVVRSLLAMGRDGGLLPRWPLGIGYTGGMVGDPAVIVLADSLARGIDFDVEAAYALAQRTADGDPPPDSRFRGRGAVETYLTLGYVPIEAGGSSASRTLEYAYADHALGALAEHLGLAEDAARYRERGTNYRNIWDSAREFLLGRFEDGTFPESVRLDRWQGFYAEGNAWQYLWYAPHDLPGLAELFGGLEPFLERLTYFFEQSESEELGLFPPVWYWHGNEPDLHASFIFSAMDDAAGTARWSRWAREVHYDDTPTGLPGNDDAGTLSAWYVFAALGFFPLAGESTYLVGSPLVTRARLHRPGGDLVVDAPDASEHAPYPREITIDGHRLERPRFDHEAIEAGGTLRFEMSATP